MSEIDTGAHETMHQRVAPSAGAPVPAQAVEPLAYTNAQELARLWVEGQGAFFPRSTQSHDFALYSAEHLRRAVVRGATDTESRVEALQTEVSEDDRLIASIQRDKVLAMEEVAALREALTNARIWHEAADKAISKQPNANHGANGWMRCQHQEQIAEITAALEGKANG